MVECAVNNPGSYEHVSFCNSFLNCFVEIDAQCERRIISDKFDKLASRTTTVPRHFGLVPSEFSTEARKKTCDQPGIVCGDTKAGDVISFVISPVIEFMG